MVTTLISGKKDGRGISLNAQVWKEGAAYIAFSPELDISSCGDSAAQAKSRLREAISLFLEESARMGALENILREAGFERRGKVFRRNRVVRHALLHVSVPTD
jgi:predicted RNase H-like HicB family nuclease